MFILIVESDPLVRLDLRETLENEFSNSTVKCTDRLESQLDFAVTADVIILDTVDPSALPDSLHENWLCRVAHVVLTNISAEGDREFPVQWRRLQRPFSEKMIVDTLRQHA